VAREHLVLVLGGTSMQTLLHHGEAQGQSLFTSGSFLKPSIAGALVPGAMARGSAVAASGTWCAVCT